MSTFLCRIGIYVIACGILSRYHVPWYMQSAVFILIAIATEIGPRIKESR